MTQLTAASEYEEHRLKGLHLVDSVTHRSVCKDCARRELLEQQLADAPTSACLIWLIICLQAVSTKTP